MTNVTRDEARKVFAIIKGLFDLLVQRYDERKYPPVEYQGLLKAFQTAHKVGVADIRRALRWKYGKSDGSTLTANQQATIRRLSARWRYLVLAGHPEGRLEALRDPLRPGHNFVSRAFLVHLCTPDKVPIIDRFNHRAVRYLLGTQRVGFALARLPESYEDLMLVRSFTVRLIEVWPGDKPSYTTVDRFLMMFGKNVAPPFKRRNAPS